eukprot:4754605-Prymnesium_polylepis.1
MPHAHATCTCTCSVCVRERALNPNVWCVSNVWCLSNSGVSARIAAGAAGAAGAARASIRLPHTRVGLRVTPRAGGAVYERSAPTRGLCVTQRGGCV